MRGVFLKHIFMLFNGNTAINRFRADVSSVLTQSLKLFSDLMSELPRVAEHESTHGFRVFLESVEHWNAEDRGLTHTRFGLAKQVIAQQCVGNALLLNFRGVLEGGIGDGAV